MSARGRIASCCIHSPENPATDFASLLRAPLTVRPRRANFQGETMKTQSGFALLVLSLVSSAALAGVATDFQAVPEPGVLELLSIGAIAAAIIAIRKRRK
jgi:uncharacterized protein involved in response to NO